jgi:hypothetical protein
MQFLKNLGEFFQDARGLFNVFTLVSLAGASALVYIAIIEVHAKGFVQVEVLYSLFFMYIVAVLSDQLLGMVIERGMWKTPPAPNTQINADVTTDNVNVSPENVNPSPTPDANQDAEQAPPPDLSKVD